MPAIFNTEQDRKQSSNAINRPNLQILTLLNAVGDRANGIDFEEVPQLQVNQLTRVQQLKHGRRRVEKQLRSLWKAY